MTAIKSNLLSFALGCIVMLFLAYKFMPKPAPVIVEKIVEVEAKKTAKKKKLDIFPNGHITLTEDEITDYLKNYNSVRQENTVVRLKHTVDTYFNKQNFKGISYKYNLTERINAGVLYKDELLGSVGWSW